jgi:dipeptidyl aminopeptidase/acylaminoacyl peptidase
MQPPRVATWILRRFGGQYRRDALHGDLIEEYQRGRSNAWYWWQVLCALTASARHRIRSRPPAMIALIIWWCVLLGLTFALKWPVIIFALDPTLYWLYRGRRKARLTNRSLLWTLLASTWLACWIKQPAFSAETVSFNSGDKVLHGLLYKPTRPGPFPTVLYNHGSAPGLLNNQAFELIGPMFTARGWAFFAPYRRGQGLSSDAGRYIMDEIQTARAHGGDVLAAETMVRLLGTEQLEDQMAALTWLKRQSFVRSSQIAAMGNSFGGIETVLGVEQGSYCAGVDASGGAESWDKAPGLQSVMLHAVQHSKAPILFVQAENDYSLAPSRSLYAAMEKSRRPAEIRIYPPYGSSYQDGHSFAYRGASIWITDVVHFMEAHCKP